MLFLYDFLFNINIKIYKIDDYIILNFKITLKLLMNSLYIYNTSLSLILCYTIDIFQISFCLQGYL